MEAAENDTRPETGGSDEEQYANDAAEDVAAIGDEEVDPTDPSTWDGDRPPEDAVARKEDFEVERDGDGDLVPVWEPVPGTGREKWVRVLPARQGDAARYLPESGSPDDLTDRQIVEVLNQFFVEPEWNLDPRNAESELEDIVAFGIDPLILAWYNASGFDYQMGMVSEHSDLVSSVEGNTSGGS